MKAMSRRHLSYLFLLLCLDAAKPAAWNYAQPWSKIRVVGGHTKWRGRVEVRVGSTWGAVCTRGWTTRDALVACRQLGMEGPAHAQVMNTNGSEPGHVWLAGLRCTGVERSLEECPRRNDSACRSSVNKTAAVQCTPPEPLTNGKTLTRDQCLDGQVLCRNRALCIPRLWLCDGADDCGDNSDETARICGKVRLAGGSDSAGLLLVFRRGKWSTVCITGNPNTAALADVTCRQLNFPKALGWAPVNVTAMTQEERVTCTGSETTVRECFWTDARSEDPVCTGDLSLTCKEDFSSSHVEPGEGLSTTACPLQNFQVPGCGSIKLRTPRIVGGREASTGAWPWMVSLRHLTSDNILKHHCGASLITDEWIITAAHCFDVTRDLSRWRVRVGDYITTMPDDYEYDSNIAQLVVHPYFNTSGHGNDIALVRLATPAQSSSLTPICLPEPCVDTVQDGDGCYATGWGDTRGTGDQTILQEVPLPVIDKALCGHWYNETITPDAFCAGYVFGGRDACKGDSGGPYACHRDGTWVLGGLVSWGKGCAQREQPGVYTDVAYHLPWIYDVISLSDAIGRLIG